MEPDPILQRFIARLPKVELHVHLEGSLRPETLREMDRRKGRDEAGLEAWIAERSRQAFRYRNFFDFIEAYTYVTLRLESPADYALATTRLLEWLAAQNVRYAELTLSAGVILWKKQSVEAIFEAVRAAAEEAEARLGLRVQWIFDAIRHFGASHAREVLHCASRFRSQGVVAFGIGGDEGRGPAELFADVFREARDLGFHLTAHAGETVGPQSVRRAVEILGAERLGHGLTAAEDPSLLALLGQRQIPLEVCLTSNLATGALASLRDHPLPIFLKEGVRVTLNSDDPGLFGTSLEREFALAAQTFALSKEQLIGLCENSIRAAFLPEEQREKLLLELRSAA